MIAQAARPSSVSRPGRTLRLQTTVQALLAWSALQLTGPAAAIELQSPFPELQLKLDNTLKYSAAARFRDPSPELVSPARNSNNANLDDGDRNFHRGLISNRIDLLSEFDASYKGYGLRLSGAAWYDAVYNRGNENPGFAGGSFPNQVSVPQNEFVHETRTIHGRDVELLDAFFYGSFDITSSQRASVRLGRHGMVWGETLFFGANGIAGGMMPVDVVKLVSVPSTQFKEAIRPVPMLSGQVQVTPETAVGAYYQLRWAKSRIPAVGSYFSVSDTLPEGAEQLLLPQPPFASNAPRRGDQDPRNSGQGGLQVRSRFGSTDVGAYLIRFHAKTPQIIPSIGPGGPSSFALVYPEGITSLGFSASESFGPVNFATELSFRRNQPLNSASSEDLSAFGGVPTDNRNNPAYPVGRTAHFNISALWAIDPNPIFREGSLVAEIGWNRVLSVSRNAGLMDPSSTRDAIAFRGVFQTVHRQVFSGVDVSPLLGLGWAPKGSRSAITTTELPQNGNGDVTLGVELTYLDAWRANLSATHYIGGTGSFLKTLPGGASSLAYRQYYGDRDFIAFSLRRSF